jgi:hypothetical protein
MKKSLIAMFLFAAGCSSTDNHTNAQASTGKEASCCASKCCGDSAKAADKKPDCCSTEAKPAKN